MCTGIMRPCMAYRKKRIKLPRESIRQLKDISYLSTIKRWEYAGGIEYRGFTFSDPTYTTSKKRDCVEAQELSDIWDTEITYHTHPGYGTDDFNLNVHSTIFTTLPSVADFEVYIKGFPWLQSNILCDAHGYYVIDIIPGVENNVLPLPEAVNTYMRQLRREPYMRIHAFSDEGYEYFDTTLQSWKRYINSKVREDLLSLFGISIRYYGYADESPIITVLREV